MAVNNEDIIVGKEIKKARVICNVFDTEYDVVKQVTKDFFCWKLIESEDEDWDIL